jgi:DNA-binding MarR family transcriptional regulator
MARAPLNSTPAGDTAVLSAPDQLDTSVLEALVGYNARRASIAIGGVFFERMAPYGLKQADFSVLALLAHNPGATSRQLCATLDILPPNFVSLIAGLDRRGLIARRPHPHDGRAVGLYLTDAGHALARETEAVVVELEQEMAGRLSERERATLQRLLQKFYLGHPKNGRRSPR